MQQRDRFGTAVVLERLYGVYSWVQMMKIEHDNRNDIIHNSRSPSQTDDFVMMTLCIIRISLVV